MISTCLKRSKYLATFVLVAAALSVWAYTAHAQSDNALSLSVAPTLFEMAAEPQQVWTSSVKVINNNRFPITVYASVANFAPQGETGQGKFIPVFEDLTEGTTLAEWIEITSDPIELDPGESKAVPFTVRVPGDANPGGHFAAIMIGTRPPEGQGTFRVKTSQVVTSLFFLRIAGDVIEDGSVREFRATKSFWQKPEVDLEVRFENKGNVHIQPQGEIAITNMWGKERGIIPINHKTHFGNVLPQSVRKFEFTWKGESQFTEIGRYTAELTLAYGTGNRQFVTSTAHFWIVPLKPVLTVLAFIVGTILFVLWAVKAYVRRMLALEGYHFNGGRPQTVRYQSDVLITRRQKLEAPVRAGWRDLTSRLAETTAFVETMKALWSFVWHYRLFFGAVLMLICLGSALWLFIASMLTDARDYEVTINNPDTDITISSEEILYDKQRDKTETVTTENMTTTDAAQDFTLTIVNSSDTAGAAAAVGRVLEHEYQVHALQSDFGSSKARSVIVYHKDLQEEALAIRQQLGDFILSALPPDDEEYGITVYVGNDYVLPESE